MNIKGRIKSVGNTEQKSAKFAVRTFVVEIEGKYPELIEFQLVNNNTIIVDPFKEGDEVDVHFNLKGREYNGRVYNSLQAWKIEGESKSNNNESAPTENAPQTTNQNKDESDLPF
jgi:single-strand DNA-binding protein